VQALGSKPECTVFLNNRRTYITSI
jgi:hypothetical protein